MKQIQVLYHNHESYLIIIKKPIWAILLGRLVIRSGLYSASHKLWSGLLFFTDKYDKEIYRTQIVSGDEACRALWGTSYNEDDEFDDEFINKLSVEAERGYEIE